MMEIILFWMTGALISGFLCRLLSLPISIGFIAAGYFFVKVDLHDKSDILEIPSELGIALFDLTRYPISCILLSCLFD